MVSVLKKTLTNYFPDLWPIIIIITIIVCTLRITYLIINHQKFCFYKELFMLFFIIYVMCLFEIVTIQDDNYGLSNFIPFKEMFRYPFGSRLFIKNIIGNILLFLPYGYFASDLLKSKKVSLICFLTLIISLTIEFVQLYIGRTFDIDDVILNTLGGSLGCYLYTIIEKIKTSLPKIFTTEGFMNLLVLIILILIILYLTDWQIINWIK